MSDEFSTPNEDEPREEQTEADFAEAAEEMAAYEETGDALDDAEAARQASIQEALVEAERQELHAKAWWSRVHPEHLTLMFANCLLFAGALVAWDRPLPWDDGPVRAFTGLDTIRGALIFALSIYGFFTAYVNIRYRQLKLRAYLLSAILGLWVGISVIVGTIGSDRWTGAADWASKQHISFLMRALAPLSAIPPGIWLITLGGLMVVWVILKGVMGGRAQAKAAARGASSSRRRRR